MTKQVLSLKTLAALIDEKGPICICGATLHGSDIGHYGPHEGGYRVEGFDEKRWGYVTCARCGYDMALHKIRRELQTREAEA